MSELQIAIIRVKAAREEEAHAFKFLRLAQGAALKMSIEACNQAKQLVQIEERCLCDLVLWAAEGSAS